MSKLRQYVTLEKFERAYKEFMKQAEKNAVSGKSEGTKTPFGFWDNNYFDGAHMLNQYGYGAASKAPHINWWVLSIYYIVETGDVVMGIEEDRYSHLKELPGIIGYVQMENKKMRVASFYESTKDNIDYEIIWTRFIDISEKIMELGLY